MARPKNSIKNLIFSVYVEILDLFIERTCWNTYKSLERRMKFTMEVALLASPMALQN